MRTSTKCCRGCTSLPAFLFQLSVVALLAVAPVGTAAAQSQPGAPPAFVTLPRHPAIDAATSGSNHPTPFRLELREEMYEMVGIDAPSHGGGGGGNVGGGGADYGQNAAVATLPDCFLGSANDSDASCAETSYQGEPMLAANALLGQLMGASNDIYPGKCSVNATPGTFGDCGAAALVSSDGSSWQRYKLTRTWGGQNFLVGFDPSVAVDSLGRAFLAYGVYNPTSGANGIAVISSANGGSAWTKTNPVVLHSTASTFEDKYWIAADANPTSSYRDRLYVAWDSNQPCGVSCTNQVLQVSSSSDQGKTWTTPVKINDGTSNSERVIFAFPAVAPDGTVYVLWHDYAKQKIFIDKSKDGGVTWGTDAAVASTNIGFGVGLSCNDWRTVSPAPQMAIDAAGNIYVVFGSDAKSGKGVDLDVYITKSSDGGAHWSQPQKVSATSTGHQYLPSISIDSLGRVNVSYLDRREDVNNCRTNTYLSRSTDHAVTFSDSKVTDADSNFDGNANGPGDYQGQASLGSVAYVFSSDHRDANATNDTTSGFIAGGFEIYAGRKP
jgi:hypothetical protein